MTSGTIDTRAHDDAALPAAPIDVGGDRGGGDTVVPPSLAGTPEAILARALLALEDAERRHDRQRVEAFERRIEESYEEIEDRARASRLAFAGSIVSGITKVAGSLVSIGGGAAGEGASGLGGALGGAAGGASSAAAKIAGIVGSSLEQAAEIAEPVLGFLGERATHAADRHEVAATAFQGASDTAEQARRDADERGQRMLDGMRELGRLRHEAALAALRG